MLSETDCALVAAGLPGMTPALMGAAVRRFGSFAALLAAGRDDCPPPLDRVIHHYRVGAGKHRRLAQRLAAELDARGIAPLPLTDHRYPALLREIHRPPPLLYVRGDITLLSLPQLAIVGSRRASSGGLASARAFAAELAAAGFAITSGLALGIDAAAHRGALDRGRTIAVLATGVDVAYPRQHAALGDQILAAGGSLVSEFPPGFAPRRESFPQRNRIISGLSLGVLVVEAAIKSGSLITARLAMEQGREVFAMPGSVHNPQAKGCHQLIREGAMLTETVADIAEQLGGLLAYKAEEAGGETPPANLPDDELAVLEAMGFEPTDIDSLVAATGMGISGLTAVLVNLELQGLVENVGGFFLRQRC